MEVDNAIMTDCGDFGWGVEDNLREELDRLEEVLASDEDKAIDVETGIPLAWNREDI